MLVRTLVVVACVLGASGRGAAEADVRGQVLFNYCTQCHGADGAGNADIEVPAVAGLPTWYVEAQLHKFRSGARGTHPDDVTGMRMRPMSLTLASDDDVAAVARYVGSLAPATPTHLLHDGDAARGQTFYQVCTACHGPDGAGNAQLFAPPLRHNGDWYLLAQLKKFRAGIRGANPADQTGILMRPMALTLPDEQAMKDVVAYILTLSE